ncbi:MAG: hypothetical protein WAK82_16920 [Streptosporangiaceae bacterium]
MAYAFASASSIWTITASASALLVVRDQDDQVDLVSQAQASRAGAQRLADRIAAIFMPCVIAVAVTTLGSGWVPTWSRRRPGARLSPSW